MHIAMLSGEYPPRWGGMGSVVFHLSGHLARLGHRVTVLTRSHSQDAPSQEGVSVIEVPWFPLPMQFTRSYGAPPSVPSNISTPMILGRHPHTPPVDLLNRREHARLPWHPLWPVCMDHGHERRMRLMRHRMSTWRNPNDLAILISACGTPGSNASCCWIPTGPWRTPSQPRRISERDIAPLRDGVPRPYSGGWIMRCSDHSSCRWKMIGPRIMPFVDDMELAMTRGSNATLEPPRPCCLL